jgi:hypothetical protein
VAGSAEYVADEDCPRCFSHMQFRNPSGGFICMPCGNEWAPDQLGVRRPDRENRGGWPVWDGVTCVECPGCGFTFSAWHPDVVGVGYSCPECDYGSTKPDLCAILGHDPYADEPQHCGRCDRYIDA